MVEGEPHRLCQVFLAWESIKIKLVSLNDSIPGQPRSTSKKLVSIHFSLSCESENELIPILFCPAEFLRNARLRRTRCSVTSSPIQIFAQSGVDRGFVREGSGHVRFEPHDPQPFVVPCRVFATDHAPKGAKVIFRLHGIARSWLVKGSCHPRNPFARADWPIAC
jgi:hypothetical protein